jgi:hypothetical protein
MKKSFAAVCLGAIGVMSVAVAVLANKRVPDVGERNVPAAPQPGAGLVVHEWGTFTGFASSDGVHLPFNQRFNADLPPFVSNRQAHAVQHEPKAAGIILFTKRDGAEALQRMETPVLYF